MRFALMIEPQQGLTYGDQVAIAKRAEANGFETLFRSDHFASFPGPVGRPTTDAWAVLAGLARETDRIGLGALVSPVTFRHPGDFAKVVTTVDEMSGGRIEVGVGAGWNELEHRQLGPARSRRSSERADLLEDQLAILHGLWGEPDGWSYDGRTVVDQRRAVLPEAGRRPRPADRTPNGGAAAADHHRRRRVATRCLRLAARYADEFNTSRRVRPTVAETYAAARRRRVGRSGAIRPRSRTRRWPASCRRDATPRSRERGRRRCSTAFGPDAEERRAWLEERRDRWSPGRRRARPGRWSGRFADGRASSGCMLQDFIPWDLDHIDVMGEAPDRPGRTARSHVRRAASAGGVGRGAVARVVAPDRVGVRAAGPGEPFGQELERRRRRRAAPRPAPGGPAPRRRASRPAGVSAGSSRGVEVGGDDRRRADAELAGRRQRLAGPLEPLAAGRRDRPGSGRARCPGRSPGRWPWRNVSRSR